MQPVVAVPAVHLHDDGAGFNGGRPAERFPDAGYGE